MLSSYISVRSLRCPCFFTEFFVSDLVVADPLFYVPVLLHDSSDLERLSGLCYQIHGEGHTFYNMLSTECTSVNALWTPVSGTLNVITVVGIRTITNSESCHSVIVDREDCSVTIDGGEPHTSNGLLFEDGKFNVKRRRNRVVVIRVPNCNQQNLILRFECETRNLFNTDTAQYEDFEMMKVNFTRRRSARFGDAQGLIGMFIHTACTLRDNSSVLIYM